jgi:asparagine synthase (glutamine-hydrolysing)
MCGIFACHHHPDVQKFKPTALRMAKALRHRGPDWSGSFIGNKTILAHERLSIVGVGMAHLFENYRSVCVWRF